MVLREDCFMHMHLGACSTIDSSADFQEKLQSRDRGAIFGLRGRIMLPIGGGNIASYMGRKLAGATAVGINKLTSGFKCCSQIGSRQKNSISTSKLQYCT